MITKEEILKIIKEQANVSLYCVFVGTDRVYPLMKEENAQACALEAKAFVECLRSEYKEITKEFPESIDCDDYANVLHSYMTLYAAGTIHVKDSDYGERNPNHSHALNFFIDENKKMRMIEGRTAVIFDPPDNYTTTFIYV